MPERRRLSLVKNPDRDAAYSESEDTLLQGTDGTIVYFPTRRRRHGFYEETIGGAVMPVATAPDEIAAWKDLPPSNRLKIIKAFRSVTDVAEAARDRVGTEVTDTSRLEAIFDQILALESDNGRLKLPKNVAAMIRDDLLGASRLLVDEEKLREKLIGMPAGNIVMYSRESYGMTREALADLVGTTTATIATLELSSKAGSMRVLGEIFKRFQWDMTDWQPQMYLSNMLLYPHPSDPQPVVPRLRFVADISPDDLEDKTLGHTVQFIHERSGITPTELSRRTGLHTKVISDVEHDAKPVGTYTFARLLPGFGFDSSSWQAQVLFEKALHQSPILH